MIILNTHNKFALEGLYRHHNVAVDQLRRVPHILEELHSSFVRLSGLEISVSELMACMLGLRKVGDLAKLGRNAKRLRSALSGLEPSDFEALQSIYLEMRVALDQYLIDEKLAKKLQASFFAATGKNIDCWQLVAAMTTKRKRGEWVRLTRTPPPTAKPFADIKEVVRKVANG